MVKPQAVNLSDVGSNPTLGANNFLIQIFVMWKNI
jgi:hypothetical protein